MPHNHFISLEEAEALTKKFREKRESMLTEAYRGKDVLLKCETFDREAFDVLLDQTGCAKVRIYLGMDTSDKVKIIVVGVDEDGRDMIPQPEANLDDTGENKILENGIRCPQNCPPTSPLNT